jgi:hypothetical protein
MPQWARIASIIDAMVLQAIGSDRPEADLLAEAQERITHTL